MNLLGTIYKVYLLVGETWKLMDTCDVEDARDYMDFLFEQGWPIVKLERIQ